ncbi:MAG: hypothetical protein LBJ18_01085 [Rickettsiales bacterium]|jgi:hypothetical protein|nr:hypothetical protein [Rickettsiales bacterium]
MPEPESVDLLIAESDRKNLAAIKRAADSGRIDSAAAEYLSGLYSDSMEHLREVFYTLGDVFGAPKTAVHDYDYKTDSISNKPVKIADINPLGHYMVFHRLDADIMRNQFFTIRDAHDANLFVSSIVSVIVASQKSIARALEKITGKYYDRYVNEVADAAARVLCDDGRVASAKAIGDKIRAEFSKKFITNPSETVLGIIGRGHESLAVSLVRELDKIILPHCRLNDVYRVKCLFDMIPQARTFISRIAKDRIIDAKDTFFNTLNPRNYRDAKIIVNIAPAGAPVVPMEIICQVRAFFNYEKQTHETYEVQRSGKKINIAALERAQAKFLNDGINQYNSLICTCVDDLLDRVGWNIIYMKDKKRCEEFLFEGFPKLAASRYPENITDSILSKLENAVKNEVFRIQNAPRVLTLAEEINIFRYMAQFIFVSAMPYSVIADNCKASGNGLAARLFNFIMTEVARYQK